MSSRSQVLAGATLLALFALALPGRTASAQECFISGPFSICPGEPAELCGPPEGDYSLEWTLPDGTHSSERCVPVTGPGVWTLRVFDPSSGASSECTREVVMLGGGVSCTIEGPASACEGTTATLCGPEGASSWNWTGPLDFSSGDRCVTVGVAGTYTLSIPGSGECGGPELLLCSHDVAFERCGTIENCPRPAVFWGRPCGDGGDHGNSRITPGQLEQVAACLDQRVALFEWENDAVGFCGTLRPHNVNLRTRAKRQFAAVWANVCAGDVGIVPARGPSVGLDPLALVLLDGTRSTVAAWLAETEASLASLESASLRGEGVKRAYREIIRAGWRINHGQGVEPVCGFTSRKGGIARLDDGSMEEDLAGDESLEEAMVDDDLSPMAMTVSGPNPFSTSSRVSFTLGSSESRDVSVGVYDLSGRLVRELARGTFEPGRHELRWDGTDQGGVRVRGGMYFVVGRIGGERVDTRLTLVR